MAEAAGYGGELGISVVIPHHGDPALALALVGRLRAQTYPGPMQVIVSDDCSPIPFPRDGADAVRRATVNGGFGTAVNAGAAFALHPMLLILNSDLMPDEDFVEGLVRAAADALPAVCSPALIEPSGWGGTAYRWPTAQVQVVGALMPFARFTDRPWFARWIMSDPAARPGVAVRTDWVAGACLYLRLEDFHAVGGFDEGFYMYGEDTDLCARLASISVPAMFLGSVQVRHGHGGSSDPARIGRWNAHARFRYARKWGFRRRLGFGLAAVMVINFGYNLVRRAAGKAVRPVERLRYDWDLIAYGWSGRDPRDG